MNAWPMMERCWYAQWRGHTPGEQAWLTWESDRGHPSYFSLGHTRYSLWATPRGKEELALIEIKIDHWPTDLQKLA